MGRGGARAGALSGDAGMRRDTRATHGTPLGPTWLPRHRRIAHVETQEDRARVHLVQAHEHPARWWVGWGGGRKARRAGWSMLHVRGATAEEEKRLGAAPREAALSRSRCPGCHLLFPRMGGTRFAPRDACRRASVMAPLALLLERTN